MAGLCCACEHTRSRHHKSPQIAAPQCCAAEKAPFHSIDDVKDPPAAKSRQNKQGTSWLIRRQGLDDASAAGRRLA
jgi:hypothetical protein